MTCKDCLHFKVCEYEGIYFEDVAIEASSADGIEDLCPLFENKADVVEVVRCKECKHFYADTYNGKVLRRECRLRSIGCGMGTVRLESENDFCSYGERREDDDSNGAN